MRLTWFFMNVASDSAYAPVMWCLLQTRVGEGQGQEGGSR